MKWLFTIWWKKRNVGKAVERADKQSVRAAAMPGGVLNRWAVSKGGGTRAPSSAGWWSLQSWVPARPPLTKAAFHFANPGNFPSGCQNSIVKNKTIQRPRLLKKQFFFFPSVFIITRFHKDWNKNNEQVSSFIIPVNLSLRTMTSSTD